MAEKDNATTTLLCYYYSLLMSSLLPPLSLYTAFSIHHSERYVSNISQITSFSFMFKGEDVKCNLADLPNFLDL